MLQGTVHTSNNNVFAPDIIAAAVVEHVTNSSVG